MTTNTAFDNISSALDFSKTSTAYGISNIRPNAYMTEKSLYINEDLFNNFKIPGSFKCFINTHNKQYKISEVYIKEVIYNNPATIVLWSDNTKTTCRVDTNTDSYNPEFGLILCVLKKLAGGQATADLMEYWAPNLPEYIKATGVSVKQNDCQVRKLLSQIRTRFNKALKKTRKK